MRRKCFILLFGLILSMLGIFVKVGLLAPLQGHYFSTYVSSMLSDGKSNYLLLSVLYRQGWRRASNAEVVRGARASKGRGIRAPFTLSDQARRHGAKTLAWRPYPQLQDAVVYQWLREEIYNGQTPWELVRWPVILGLIFVGLGLFGVIRQDRKDQHAALEGRILRGPRLMTRAEFNFAKSSDDIPFTTLEPLTQPERLSGCDPKHQRVRIPGQEESIHLAPDLRAVVPLSAHDLRADGVNEEDGRD